MCVCMMQWKQTKASFGGDTPQLADGFKGGAMEWERAAAMSAKSGKYRFSDLAKNCGVEKSMGHMFATDAKISRFLCKLTP